MELKSDNIEEKYYSKQQKQEEEEEEDFHVLAVDDSLIDRKLLEKLLKVSSFKVTCVDSGDAALKYLGLLDQDDDFDKKSTSSSTSSSTTTSPQSPDQQVSKVNLIMTDYCMPGMSGYDLLKRIKGSSWKDVPVVIMSSENVPSRISMCLEEGAEEFLIKPLQLSDLKRLQSYSSSDQSTHEDLNFKGNSSNVRKRKSVSLGTSERKIPKTKGLTVV